MLAETKLSPAARAYGPPAKGFQAEFLDLARLADIQPEWRRLLDGAGEPNPGAMIAAAVHLVAGSSAAAFKCAYDEDWGRMSPGALLDLHSLRFALDEGRFALMDSCAVPGHPVETLWRDRVQVGRIAIGLGTPGDGRALDSFARRQQTVSAWKADAQALMKRLDRLGTELRSGGYFGKAPG